MPQIETLLSPGVYVQDSPSNKSIELVAPSVAYMLGTSTNVVDINAPKEVSSTSDFSAKFPASPSLVYVEMYFAQTNRPLLFINIARTGTLAPVLSEINASLNQLSERYEPGILFAPELFADEDRTDSVAVANALGSKAVELQWLSVIDAPFTSRSTVGSDDVTPGSIRAFAASLSASAKPAINFIGTWLRNTSDVEVAASGAVVGMYIYVWTRFGFSTPPAGTEYPLNGVSSTLIDITKSLHDVLNPKNINVIRYFRNSGWCLYGSRMLDGTFVNTKVVLNVISASMASAVQRLVFANIDSQGMLFIRARELAESVLYRVWTSGGLAGNSPQDAYAVICDSTNNTPSNLQSGRLVIDIYQAPSSTVEVVLVVPHRVVIGGLANTLENLR
jgi:phage tail sheath protein FI